MNLLYRFIQDIALDTYLGRSKAPAIAINAPITRSSGSQNQNQNQSQGQKNQIDPSLQHAAYLPKPQLKFITRVDNNDSDGEAEWDPSARMKHKWNAKMPLGYVFREENQGEDGEGEGEGPVCVAFF